MKECPQAKFKGDDDDSSQQTIDCIKVTRNNNCKITKKNYYRSKGIINRLCIPYTEDDSDSIDYDAIFLTTQNTYTDPVSQETYVKYESVLDYLNNRNSTEGAKELFNWSYFDTDKLISWMVDLYECWIAIALSFVWSLILCMIFLLFVRCCAGVIIYIIIFLILVVLTGLGAFFFVKREEYDEVNDSKYYNAMIVLAWIFWGFAFIWLIFIICMCNRIRLAVALTEVTSKYINKTWCIVFVPFLFFVILVIWLAYWIVMLVFLYTSGEFESTSKIFASFKMDETLEYGFWFHIVMLFYITAVIEAYSQFVYASSACIWYFNFEKGTENHPIAKSFQRGIRYHFGSLVFGATIIAIIRFLMFFVEYIKKKLEKSAGKTQGKCFKCIFCVIQCCLGCCNKIMEFINKHAYIQIALKGDSFCTAAFEGFGLIIRNLGRFSMLALIGGMFTLIGTLFITVGSCIIGYFLITRVHYFSDELNSCVLPVVAFGIVGFVMGRVTMSIFSVSGDALIHSFLLDEELNKGQPKAFPELQKFMSDER